MPRGRQSSIQHTRAFQKLLDSKAKCKQYHWTAVQQSNNLTRYLITCPSLSQSQQLSIRDNLNIHKPLRPQEEEQFKQAIAITCYYNGLPFRAFENGLALKKAFHLINPLLPLPTHSDIATKLLDEQYTQISTQVNTLIAEEPHINFSVNESTNIRHQRTLNICTNTTTYGSFYQASKVIDIESITATVLSQWIISSIRKLLRNRLTNILNSMAMDTCATNRATGKQIKSIAQFKHIFIVMYDSHSLQLLIKDLLEKGSYVDVFN